MSVATGGEVLIAGPTFSDISETAMRYAESVTLHLGASAFESDYQGFLDSITEKTKLIYLGAPNNPTGIVYSEKEIQKILERAQNAVVIVDETQLVGAGQSLVQYAGNQSRMIVIRSMQEVGNKNSPCCAYVVTNPIIKSQLMSATVIQIDSRAASHAIAALENNDVENIIQGIEENKTFVTMRLRSLERSVRDTMFDKVMVEVAEPLEVQIALQQVRIHSRNCTSLPQLKNWLEITISDDVSARTTIDTFESLPTQVYQMKSQSLETATNVNKELHSSSTLTIRRGPENRMNVEPRNTVLGARRITTTKTARETTTNTEASQSTEHRTHKDTTA